MFFAELIRPNIPYSSKGTTRQSKREANFQVGTSLFAPNSFLILATWVCRLISDSDAPLLNLLQGSVLYAWISCRTFAPVLLGATGLVFFLYKSLLLLFILISRFTKG